ncbi:MAG: queuosine precursor transporter [Planctomycetota bacterium]
MERSISRYEAWFLMLGGLFVAALVVCNLIASKFVTVDLGFLGFTNPFVVSAGVLPYPVTFLITDILSEVYGRRRANQVVLTGFAASVFVLGILLLGDVFSAIPESPVDDATYTEVFGKAPRVVFASMVAYLVAQLVDIRVFHFWKRVTNGRHLWLRNNASTVFSQLVDTILVVSVLFVGVKSTGEIAALVVDGWLFKILCALVDTPIFYLAVGGFRRALADRPGVSQVDR